MPHSPASRIGWWTDCGPCSTRLRGWIYASRRTEHVTPFLRDLHWLRYPDRIDYKLAVLGLQMPPWTGAELPRRRIHACVGDCVATESSVGFDGQSCRASLSAKDTRRSCIPCGSGSSMEQPTVTVTCHIIFIVGVIQTQSQDWAVSWDRTFKAWYRLMLNVTCLTLLRALEVNFDLRHVNHIFVIIIIKYSSMSRLGLTMRDSIPACSIYLTFCIIDTLMARYQLCVIILLLLLFWNYFKFIRKALQQKLPMAANLFWWGNTLSNRCSLWNEIQQ